MDYRDLLIELTQQHGISICKAEEMHPDEVYIRVESRDLRAAAAFMNKRLRAPVSMLFAQDRRLRNDGFAVYCVFLSSQMKKWLFLCASISAEDPRFDSLSGVVYSAALFEREIREMFGIESVNSTDIRRIRLHEEVWPQGRFPLRKDFKAEGGAVPSQVHYGFTRVEGEGVFEAPVGPVHAGVIGPGHFRFSSAGEPIINLEIRLGFTHRGVEKLFEGRHHDAAALAECVAGDSAVSHAVSFCHALEKIYKVPVPVRGRYIRAICLELERLYNHANDIGGIAVDVGFTFPSAFCAVIKETVQSLNRELFNHRFLKGVLCCGGVTRDIDDERMRLLNSTLKAVRRDLGELKEMLFSSVSFIDRVDTTGILRRKTAEDLGVTGVAARASGLHVDLRKDFNDIYEIARFRIAQESSGDVLARLRVRISEFEESMRLIDEFAHNMPSGPVRAEGFSPQAGCALGYTEGWRGPVLYWIETDPSGAIDRCKIVDPSFLNWQGLAYCVLGEIIPDFPVCNKSFDLSYSGSDL
ncbi:MAG: NADH-quinone oxidoreductase subunit C [Candidatus Omnitrophica bacterium]|nr:NADH-quinone oxidoreductase subunit C [Candidatus Omnitrophota bacterium]